MPSTYTPTGTGLCATCGRDVGAHVDPAHKFVECEYTGACYKTVSRDGRAHTCAEFPDHPVHDPGRILRCPEVRDD